jgi:Acetyltransferases, including N-acetylases of ribosomal proteins
MLRRLEQKDAPLMLEWMHDNEINCNFQADFASSTPESVLRFISDSFNDENQNFAFVDENDEYLGTISLKHISYKNGNAEYAIVARKKAQGTGAAMKATQELLQYAFEELGLHKVYLNVLKENVRAQKMYEKCGFVYEGSAVDAVKINGRYRTLMWYGILNCFNRFGNEDELE